jgi:hypothetical protein
MQRSAKMRIRHLSQGAVERYVGIVSHRMRNAARLAKIGEAMREYMHAYEVVRKRRTAAICAALHDKVASGRASDFCVFGYIPEKEFEDALSKPFYSALEDENRSWWDATLKEMPGIRDELEAEYARNRAPIDYSAYSRIVDYALGAIGSNLAEKNVAAIFAIYMEADRALNGAYVSSASRGYVIHSPYSHEQKSFNSWLWEYTVRFERKNNAAYFLLKNRLEAGYRQAAQRIDGMEID